MKNQFGNKIRALREEQNLLLRQVASILEMDTAQLSKIERGDRQANKETVLKIAVILKVQEKVLLTLWLADQIYDVVKDDENALQAMMVAEDIVKYEIKKKKWILRSIATVLFLAGLLMIIILNPILTYANKTPHKNFSIYHNQNIDPILFRSLDQATILLKTSEFFTNNLKLDICLNEGSTYPTIIKTLRGRAFAWGFYDKVVLQGTMNCKANFVELNGYKWNLTQLLAHEMTHCLQFEKLGFWGSKPISNIPNWKWEGYAEYVSRQNADQKDLKKNIDRLQQTDKNIWEVKFEDNTITSREYYNYWSMVKYCLDVKKMSYQQLLTDETSEQSIKQEMMKWYQEIKSKRTTSVMQFDSGGAFMNDLYKVFNSRSSQ